MRTTPPGLERPWLGPLFASPFPGALGSSRRKGMPAIRWCRGLAAHPGRGQPVPEPSKDAGEGRAPRARSFLCPDWHAALRRGEETRPRQAPAGRRAAPPRRPSPAPAEGPVTPIVPRVVRGGTRRGVSEGEVGSQSPGPGPVAAHQGRLPPPLRASLPPGEVWACLVPLPSRVSVATERGGGRR